MVAFEDAQLTYYINRGYTTGTVNDRRRDWYIDDIIVLLAGPPPTVADLEQLTTDDLEIQWLQLKAVSSSYDGDDLWFAYLNPIYGPGKAVRDLRYELYLAG